MMSRRLCPYMSTKPMHPITTHVYVLRMKSLSEMCRRLPRAEAMLVVVVLDEGWRRDGEVAPAACAPVRPSNRRLLLPALPRQPASIIMGLPV